MRMRLIVTLVLLVVSACGTAAQQTASKSSKSATTPADLDGLLAPIALYPDQLIAQMLLCAADPAKVVELSTWLAANKALKGTELQDAATVEGFEPSFVAMTLFPQVVSYMAERRDWTTQLGKTFAANQSAVFDSIQRLRKKAHEAGALKTTPQQEVETKTTSNGQQVIVIEPANPQIIYVPQYDPQVVYVQQPTTTTVVVEKDNSADAAVAGLIGFTAGIAIGAAVDNDYYYGPYGWHGGGYMYNDAWNDYYDAREDAREDWTDHREDLVEERGERAGDAREQRTERTEGRQETRTETQGQRTERQQTRQENQSPQAQQQRTEAQAQAQQRRTDAQAQAQQAKSTAAASSESRGRSSNQASSARTGTSSDAFSGYSGGKSERAASSRGQRSRGGSSGGGGRRR
jgi:hypothetical protein